MNPTFDSIRLENNSWCYESHQTYQKPCTAADVYLVEVWCGGLHKMQIVMNSKCLPAQPAYTLLPHSPSFEQQNYEPKLMTLTLQFDNLSNARCANWNSIDCDWVKMVSKYVTLSYKCRHIYAACSTLENKVWCISPWKVVWFSHIIYCLCDYQPEGRQMQCHR